MIAKLTQGLSARTDARDVGCVPSTVARIPARFVREDEASLYDRRAENGDRKVDDDVRQGVWEILLRNPETLGFERSGWYLALLARSWPRPLRSESRSGTCGRCCETCGAAGDASLLSWLAPGGTLGGAVAYGNFENCRRIAARGRSGSSPTKSISI